MSMSPEPPHSQPPHEASAPTESGWMPQLDAQPPLVAPTLLPPPAYPSTPMITPMPVWPGYSPYSYPPPYIPYGYPPPYIPCSYPPPYVPYGYPPPPYFQLPIVDPGSGAAVASLILGIVSAFVIFLVFVPCLPLLGLGAAIAGIVTGALGLKSTTRHGMAVGGLVTSVIALALGIGLFVGYIILNVLLISITPPAS